MLPNDVPPVSTVRGYFYTWRDDGLLDEMTQKLMEAARLAESRKAQPTAGAQAAGCVKSPRPMDRPNRQTLRYRSGL